MYNINLRWIVAVLVIYIIAVIVLVFSTGCNIERYFSRQRSDSTAVSKVKTGFKDSVNSGSVSTNNSKSKEDYEWWRMIVENMPKGDTTVTVNNIYPAPARVIYEGGSGTRQEEKQSKDSTWMHQVFSLIKESLDSTNRRIDNVEKQSKTETKGLGLFTLILLMGGAVVLFKLMGFIGNNYSITKKK